MCSSVPPAIAEEFEPLRTGEDIQVGSGNLSHAQSDNTLKEIPRMSDDST
jgi:hypothetical protein